MKSWLFVLLLTAVSLSALTTVKAADTELAKYTFDNRVSATAPEPAQDAESILARKKVTAYIPNTNNGESGPALTFVDLKQPGGRPLFYDSIERGGSLLMRGAQMLATEKPIAVRDEVTIELGTKYELITQVWYNPILLDVKRGSTDISIEFVEANQGKGTWKLRMLVNDEAVFTSEALDFKTWYSIRLTLQRDKIALALDDKPVAHHALSTAASGDLTFALDGELDPEKRTRRGAHLIYVDQLTITEPSK